MHDEVQQHPQEYLPARPVQVERGALARLPAVDPLGLLTDGLEINASDARPTRLALPPPSPSVWRAVWSMEYCFMSSFLSQTLLTHSLS